MKREGSLFQAHNTRDKVGGKILHLTKDRIRITVYGRSSIRWGRFFSALVPCLLESFHFLLAYACGGCGCRRFLVRIFIIFHDCCHKSFFKNRMANEMVGTITGILTCCPYYQWRHTHTVHHATSGNLSKRGTGDIWTLTVAEYLSASC